MTRGSQQLVPYTSRRRRVATGESGFFYVTGHGVPPDLLSRLTRACTAFFALPQADKMEIVMARWRGYFPVGAELTSGQPDLKEVSKVFPQLRREVLADEER